MPTVHVEVLVRMSDQRPIAVPLAVMDVDPTAAMFVKNIVSVAPLIDPRIHPVAVRAVYDVRQALPEVPIVGVGGVASGWDAAELMIAGAQAVQVGTASFADPRACARIARELVTFATDRGIARLADFNAVV